MYVYTKTAYIYIYTLSGKAVWWIGGCWRQLFSIVSEFRDVVFEDVVFDIIEMLQ